MQTEDRARAEQLYRKALAAVPGFPEAHLGLGHLALGAKNPAQALAEYEAAREGYIVMGDAVQELQAQRYRDAQRGKQEIRDAIREAGRSASRTDPASPRNPGEDARRYISQLEDQLRQLDAITPPTQQASKDVPPEILFHLGNAQFRLDRMEEARQSWEACAAAHPDFPVVHNNLAVVYWKLGRLEDAKRSLARAKALSFPVNPEFEASLARQ
jgi:tetratricopeptide (TPR) repeat protein